MTGGTGTTAGSGGSTPDGSAGQSPVIDAGKATPFDGGEVDPGEPIGWAAVDADNQNGTFGGRGGPGIEVATLADLTRYAADALPRVVRITGNITLPGRLQIGSNKTIVGAPGATLQGSLEINNQVNVILQNLTIRGNDCFGSTTSCGSDDAMEVFHSHHVWLDHLHFTDGSDGNLDIRDGSSYVTVSWTKFSYSRSNRPHRFSNLIGADDNVPIDQGRLKVTFHHDWWADNVNQRMPRTRSGEIHVFNNLFTSSGNSYCTNAGVGASLLVESNIYRRVNTPHFMDSLGNLLARNNVYEETTGDQKQTGVAFTPPYAYTADPTDGLADTIAAQAGPH